MSDSRSNADSQKFLAGDPDEQAVERVQVQETPAGIVVAEEMGFAFVPWVAMADPDGTELYMTAGSLSSGDPEHRRRGVAEGTAPMAACRVGTRWYLRSGTAADDQADVLVPRPRPAN